MLKVGGRVKKKCSNGPNKCIAIEDWEHFGLFILFVSLQMQALWR